MNTKKQFLDDLVRLHAQFSAEAAKHRIEAERMEIMADEIPAWEMWFNRHMGEYAAYSKVVRELGELILIYDSGAFK